MIFMRARVSLTITEEKWGSTRSLHVLWRTGTQDNDFLFLSLNFDDTVLWNLTPVKIANI